LLASSGVEVVPFIENKKHGEVIDKTKKKIHRNFLIPKVINAIYPKIKHEDYESLKNDALFNSKTASVCEICYMNITRYCDFAKSNTENVLRILRSKEINAESKYLKYMDLNENNTHKTVGKYSMKNIKENLRNKILNESGNFIYKKQISSNTLYPKIINTNLFTDQKVNENYRKGNPENTEIQ